MQKVVGSSPIIRSSQSPQNRSFSLRFAAGIIIMMARVSRRPWLVGAALLLLGVGVFVALLVQAQEGSTVTGDLRGSGNALLVHRSDEERLLVGTDDGAFESSDGGRSWRRSGLDGRQVVALARLEDGTVWAGGPGLLARSPDGGRSWTDARPQGLPSLDVRALSGSRDVSGRLEAAIGGEGLFRSNDGGRTFEKLGPPTQVGNDAQALAETIDGVIFLSDERRGVLTNSQGDGAEWVDALDRSSCALAPNYDDRHHAVLLAGSEEGVLRTTDQGQTWAQVLPLDDGCAAVAFSQGRIELAYALAADGTSYRSTDFGATWTATG
jgi:photosystem II stability/assembly factor-like uncharacterized protein